MKFCTLKNISIQIIKPIRGIRKWKMIIIFLIDNNTIQITTRKMIIIINKQIIRRVFWNEIMAIDNRYIVETITQYH